MRRVVLKTLREVQPSIRRWSYLASYGQGTPFLGTFHGTDVIKLFYGDLSDFPSRTILAYYLNFAYNLDPNDETGNLMVWPEWNNEEMTMINFGANDATLIKDDFRSESFNVIFDHIKQFYY